MAPWKKEKHTEAVISELNRIKAEGVMQSEGAVHKIDKTREQLYAAYVAILSSLYLLKKYPSADFKKVKEHLWQLLRELPE